MKNYDDVFREVERAVIALAPDHVPCSNAPDTWETLKAWKLSAPRQAPIPVWNGASEQTIYSTPGGNYAFRAWHDSLHLLTWRDFGPTSEIALGNLHRATLRRMGCSPQACAAIWVDTAGQTMYESHYSEFPVDQRAFVSACLALTGATRDEILRNDTVFVGDAVRRVIASGTRY